MLHSKAQCHMTILQIGSREDFQIRFFYNNGLSDHLGHATWNNEANVYHPTLNKYILKEDIHILYNYYLWCVDDKVKYINY